MSDSVSSSEANKRQGSFLIMSLGALVAAVGFVAFSVDLGLLSLEKTRVQSAADAAALAAAQQITVAVEDLSNSNDPNVDVNALAIGAAKQMAADVAEMNGVYVDPDADVAFGKRYYDEDTEQFTVAWGSAPYTNGESYNVVKVTVSKDSDDPNAPNAKVPLFFSGFYGTGSATVSASAVAYVESRDMVAILDFSGSMSYDSTFRQKNTFGQQAIEDNLEDIYNALVDLDDQDMVFTPQWLTVEGPASGNAAQIDVTFKREEVYVESTQAITKVKLKFDNGNYKTFNNPGGLTGTFQGTGGDADNCVTNVWVTAGSASAEVSGVPQNNSKKIPHIDVVFHGTTVDVTSTKKLKRVEIEFDNGGSQVFNVSSQNKKSMSFQGTGSNSGKTISDVIVKSWKNHDDFPGGQGESFSNPGVSGGGGEQQFDDSNANVQAWFGLDQVQYPYNSGSWDEFINYCRTDSDIINAGYKNKYGGLCFAHYLLEKKLRNSHCHELWRTPHYPFHAMKNGMSLLLEFLDDLDFGDQVGLVSYDDSSRVEHTLYSASEGINIDLSADPISDQYDDLDTIQRHKQASHYAPYTGLGYGMGEARTLMSNYKRFGSRPTMILMTDGNANRSPNGWSLPGDWDWAEVTDFDGNGSADYTTNDRHKQYAFWQVMQAVEEGVTVHTLTVGAGADRNLMQALANAGGGEWINVPGGSTIAEMEAQMLAAFSRIAANVPPAKLLSTDN